jgi:hypothetical protein
VSFKYKVGQLDVAATGSPIVVIVKPAISHSAEHAPSILNWMAARGPRYRVGLVPSTTSRTWDFCHEPGSWCTQSFDISGQQSMQEILDYVVGEPLRRPISVSQAGEYLCVVCDHGIGDMNIVMEVCATLMGKLPYTGLRKPLAAPMMTNPWFATLFDAAKVTPRLFVKDAIGLLKPAWSFFRSYVAALINRPHVVPSGPTGDQDEKYVAVWSKSDPEFIEEVREYRDSKHPNASVKAILMLRICRALQECGVSLSDELEVAVDMRRFLPRDKFTLANFFAIGRVNIGAQPSVDDFAAALRLMVGSVSTLFRLAGYLAVNRAEMLFARRTRKTEQPVRGPAKADQSILTISDHSNSPFVTSLAWARPDDFEIASAVPPTGRSHISVATSTAPNGSVQLTATFYASHIDKLLVAQGLSRALSSMALNQQPETTSQPCGERHTDEDLPGYGLLSTPAGGRTRPQGPVALA